MEKIKKERYTTQQLLSFVTKSFAICHLFCALRAFPTTTSTTFLVRVREEGNYYTVELFLKLSKVSPKDLESFES